MANHLLIKDLEVECIIGIHDWERQKPQKLLMDLKGFFDFSPVISSHAFKDTIDYVAISNLIIKTAQEGKYKLLEAMADDLSKAIFERFPITSLQIVFKKQTPDVPKAKYVGICFDVNRHKPISSKALIPENIIIGKEIHKDRVALITGAAQGLGKALAYHLGFNGAKLAIHYRKSKSKADDLLKDFEEKNIKARKFQGDLSSFSEINKMIENVMKEFDSIDYLINNVGAYSPKGLWETSSEEFQHVLQTNLSGTYHLSKNVLPIMRKRGFGRIINIGQAGVEKIRGFRRETPYQISKTGLLILTKSIGLVEAENGITCNMISPGVMENNSYFPQNIFENIPMKRLGKFEDFFGPLDFLLSPKANYITGTNIEVSGGFRL